MKKMKGLFLIVCLAILPMLQSCDDDDDGYSLGDFSLPEWATVRVKGNAFYLDCDVWGTLWPVNLDLNWYEPIDGQRVLTIFNPLSDSYEGFDHAVKILRIQDVLTKRVETLTSENEQEFGNDPVLTSKGNIGISGGYMNILFIQNLPAKTKHRISLVQRAEDTAGNQAEGDGYIHLELRYNDYDDLTGDRNYGLVSFNLKELNITSATKGIKLSLNSEKNGPVEVTFDLKKEDSSNVKNAGNYDFTKMQLK